MYVYAQINDEGVCMGISMLASEVESDDLVEIPSYDDDYLWRKYDRDTGEWSVEKYEPVEPEPADKITELQLAIAELAGIVASMMGSDD